MNTKRRRFLKDHVKQKTARTVDQLAKREAFQAKGFIFLGGLHDVAWRASKSKDWVYDHFMSLADRKPEVILYQRGGL